MNDEGEPPSLTLDAIFGDRLRLLQAPKGHRVGTDAVLLAAAAGTREQDRFIDVGAGSGAVGLALAIRQPLCTGVLLERDGLAAKLAARNITENGMSGRLVVASLDLFDRQSCKGAGVLGAADLVVTNPPFYAGGSVRASPDPARAAAHVHDGVGDEGQAAWLARAAALLKPKGRLVTVNRADALPVLLAELGRQFGGIILRPVHPRTDAPAHRVLVGATRGSRAPLTILPGLVLHAPDGRFTPEAEYLHQGGDMMFWPKKKVGPGGRPSDGNDGERSAQ